MTVHPLQQTEKGFTQAVLELARLHGWLAAHFHDSRRQVRPGVYVGDKDAAGFPDVFLVHPKKQIALSFELKVGKNKPTAKQDQWLDALDKAGIPSYVLRPDDMPLIRKLLSA